MKQRFTEWSILPVIGRHGAAGAAIGAIPMLLTGCMAAASDNMNANASTTDLTGAIIQSLSTFFFDFARQLIAAIVF